MYTVERGISTMQLLDYLEVAPEGTVVEKEDNGKPFFKLCCGKWTDGECNTYGNVDLALEVEGDFKPFNLNDYRLYVGNYMACGNWPVISTDEDYTDGMIEEIYRNWLLNEVGVKADDRDMVIHVSISTSAPIRYMVMLESVLTEFRIKHDIEILS